MAISHAASDELIDVLPLCAKLRQTSSSTLVSADQLEVFRLVLAAGKAVPDHKAARVRACAIRHVRSQPSRVSSV